MTDTVITGTGNSRTLKMATSLPATYDEFRALAISSGILADIGPLNAAGVQTMGTELNKANLLTDALCTALGIATTSTPTQAMDKLRELIADANNVASSKLQVLSGTYTGSGSSYKSVSAGKTIKAVLVVQGGYGFSSNGFSAFATPSTPAEYIMSGSTYTILRCTGSSFYSYNARTSNGVELSHLNSSGVKYHYIVWY